MEKTVLISIDASKEKPETFINKKWEKIVGTVWTDLGQAWYDKEEDIWYRVGIEDIIIEPKFWYKPVPVSSLPSLFPEMVKEELIKFRDYLLEEAYIDPAMTSICDEVLVDNYLNPQREEGD